MGLATAPLLDTNKNPNLQKRIYTTIADVIPWHLTVEKTKQIPINPTNCTNLITVFPFEDANCHDDTFIRMIDISYEDIYRYICLSIKRVIDSLA